MTTETTAPSTAEPRPRRYRLWLAVVDLCLAGAIIATVLSWGARVWWVFELATHFRVYYAACLMLVLVLFALGRKWKRAAVAAAFVLFHLAGIAPVYFSRETAPAGQPVLRCLFANVFTANREHEKLIDVIRKERPDVVVVAEVNARWLDALQAIESEYPYGRGLPREDNFGIALYSRIAIDEPTFPLLGESRVPSVAAVIPFDGKSISLWGTHPVPPRSGGNSRNRNLQLQALAEAARAPRPAIVIGDLNVTPWSPYFGDILETSGLRDSRQGFGIQPTWSKREIVHLPIDHALVSPDLIVVDRRVGPDIGSDHRPVIVDVAIRK